MLGPWHPSLRGVAAGAAVGGIGRGLVVALHLTEVNDATFSLVLVGAMIGAGIGSLAGLVGRVGLGAIVGAALAVVVFAITLPIVSLFDLLGAGSTPSIVATVAMGAVAGLAGGAAAASTTPRQATARERIELVSRGGK